jgi:hypothetical protein
MNRVPSGVTSWVVKYCPATVVVSTIPRASNSDQPVPR